MVGYERAISPIHARNVSTTMTVETQKILDLGQLNGWEFNILGQAEMPEQAVRLENWLIVPAHEDTSQVPVRTLKRIRTIYAAGIRPVGFVVVHEAPRLLPAPRPEKSDAIPKPDSNNIPSRQTGTDILSVASTIITGTMGLFVAFLSIVSTLILPMAFLGMLALDPIVVAVMEDGYWIEIDRWFNQ